MTGAPRPPADDLRCARLSAFDEPLEGTATRVGGWVCLEHPSPWGRDVLDGTAFGAQLAERLRAHVDAAGLRLMLIRRPGRPAMGPAARRVYLAQSHPHRARCTEFTVDSPDDLLDLDLSCAAPDAPAGTPWPGRAVADPVTLVCTHGRRDQCCAIDGRPVAAALAADGADVWECSHTGGHRFAPSMIVLPTGYSYGRVSPADARAAVAAIRAGRLSPQGLRGRSCWGPAGQVAELAVRRSLPGEDVPLDALAAVPTDPVDADPADAGPADAGPTAHLVTHRDGRRWRIATRTQALAPRATSCGGGPKPVTAARALSVEEI